MLSFGTNLNLINLHHQYYPTLYVSETLPSFEKISEGKISNKFTFGGRKIGTYKFLEYLLKWRILLFLSFIFQNLNKESFIINSPNSSFRNGFNNRQRLGLRLIT